MKYLLSFVALAAAVLSASAQTKIFPAVSIAREIEGVSTSFTAELAVERPIDGGRLRARIKVDLSDLLGKASGVIGSVWAREGLNVGGKLEYKGTLLGVEGQRLWTKVHFRFRPGGGFPSSNGSVVTYFDPVVVDQRIGLRGQVAELNISNDLVRGIADALNVDDLVRDKLSALLSRALSAPQATLALPEAVQALGVDLDTAGFENSSGRPCLMIDGSLPAVAGILLGI